MFHKSAIRLVALLCAATSYPALAATVMFSGTFQNTNPPASPTGRCAPAALTVNIGPGLGIVSGASNLGAFTPTTSHCINPPLPTSYSDGLFLLRLSQTGNILTGSYFGVLSLSGTPGVFNNVQNFTALGGSGTFLNATGVFTGLGTVTFAQGQPPFSTEALSGMLGPACGSRGFDLGNDYPWLRRHRVCHASRIASNNPLSRMTIRCQIEQEGLINMQHSPAPLHLKTITVNLPKYS